MGISTAFPDALGTYWVPSTTSVMVISIAMKAISMGDRNNIYGGIVTPQETRETIPTHGTFENSDWVLGHACALDPVQVLYHAALQDARNAAKTDRDGLACSTLPERTGIVCRQLGKSTLQLKRKMRSAHPAAYQGHQGP